MDEKTKFLGELIATTAHRRTFSRGEVIQHQHQPVSNLCLILSGNAYALSTSRNGKEFWKDDYTVGSILGFEAFIGEAKANYDVITRSDVTLLSMPISDLTALASKHPSVFVDILTALTEIYYTQTQKLVEANTLSKRGRICAELKRHSRPMGIEPGTYVIRPTPIFSEFALRIGSTRESVSRTVSELTDMGLLIRKVGALLIPDMSELDETIQ